MTTADYHTSDIYRFYKSKTSNPVNWKTFKQILLEFNDAVIENIIMKGHRYNQGAYLSTLGVLKIERDPNTLAVNWKKSHKLKQQLLSEGKKLYNSETGEGHKWLVYYTDNYYYRIWWNKASCNIPNKSVYKFIPAGGATGLKTALKNAIAEGKNFKIAEGFERLNNGL